MIYKLISLLSLFFIINAYSSTTHSDQGKPIETSDSLSGKTDNTASVIIQKRMAGFEQFAQKIRELNFIKPVAYITVKKEAVKEILNKKLEQQYSDKEFNDKIEAYVKIGLLDSSKGIREIMLGMLGEQIAGFYDTDRHVLYTISDLGLEPQFDAMIYVHELTHALQDQHFNLTSLGINDKGNDDKVAAVMSLIEGDATLVIMQYFTKYGKLNLKMLMQAMLMDSSKLNSAPYVLKKTLMFPYMDGMGLINKIYNTKGWTGVNEAYKKPPVSSEQILHPEKYFKKIDEPTAIKLPNLKKMLGREWRVLDDNVMGELNTQILFDIHLGKWSSKKPSAGWDGDRYNVLENIKDGSYIFVWESVWDSEKDADEFYTAYNRIIEKKYPDIIFERKGTPKCGLYSSKNLYIYASQENEWALIIEASDESLLQKVLKKLNNHNQEWRLSEILK